MRKVEITDYERYIDISKNKTVKTKAVFHQFGSDYEEFESGPGNFTTAIVELSDGTIRSVPVEHIRFLEALKELESH